MRERGCVCLREREWEGVCERERESGEGVCEGESVCLRERESGEGV